MLGTCSLFSPQTPAGCNLPTRKPQPRLYRSWAPKRSDKSFRSRYLPRALVPPAERGARDQLLLRKPLEVRNESKLRLTLLFLASYYARCGLICANVDGITRRRKRSPDIRCRIENFVQSSRRQA